MRIVYTLVLVFLLSFNLPAQTFIKTYGGQYHEVASDMVENSDGGFTLAGKSQTYSNGNYDVWVVRVDSVGDTLWTRNFGGVMADYARSVARMPDSGFIVAGNTMSYGVNTPSSANWYLLRLNGAGDTLWTWHYNNYGNDDLYDVLPTSDGGYLLTGWTYFGGYAKGTVMKLDSARNQLWIKYIPSGANSYAFEAIEEPSGDYIVTASSLGGTFNVFLRRYSSSGTAYLPATFHSYSSKADAGLSIIPAHGGGYMVAGIYGNYGSYDMWLLRTNHNLDTLWTRFYPGVFDLSQLWQKEISVALLADGYLLCGKGNNAGQDDMRLVKVDTSGNVLWTKHYGTPLTDCGFKGIVTSDNRIAACGYSLDSLGQQNMLLTVTDTGGNMITPPSWAAITPSGQNTVCDGDSLYVETSFHPSYSYSWFYDSVAISTNDNGIWIQDSGSYWVVISAGGILSDSSQVLHLDYFEQTDLFLGMDTIICTTHSVTLDAGAGYDAYLWSSGDTTQQLTLNNMPVGDHDIFLVAEDSNGCLAFDTIRVTIVDCSDIVELHSAEILVYPNPASSFIRIDGADELAIARIYDMQGSLVWEGNPDREGKIATDNFMNGLYLVQIDGMSLKFMVMHP